MIAEFSFHGEIALLVLRVALGALLIAHGWPKMKNLKGTAASFTGMGFKPGWFFAPVAAVVECLGGIGLVIGFLVVPVAALLVIQFFILCIWKITKKMSFTGTHGWELDLLILAAAFTLLFLGAGAFSIDRTFFPLFW